MLLCPFCPRAGVPLRGCTSPARVSRVHRAETSSRSYCVVGINQVREELRGCCAPEIDNTTHRFVQLYIPTYAFSSVFLVSFFPSEGKRLRVALWPLGRSRAINDEGTNEITDYCCGVERRPRLRAFVSVTRHRSTFRHSTTKTTCKYFQCPCLHPIRPSTRFDCSCHSRTQIQLRTSHKAIYLLDEMRMVTRTTKRFISDFLDLPHETRAGCVYGSAWCRFKRVSEAFCCDTESSTSGQFCTIDR